jgi:hypothetical protein
MILSKPWQSVRPPSVLGALILLAVPLPSSAGPLTSHTGYTRPGTPSDQEEAGKIISAAGEKNALGGTVYFMVLDRLEGQPGDTWGTGIKDFDSTFKPGKGTSRSGSPALDTSARYLYLYQTVNDRGSPSSIQSTSVRLLVPPHLITSWGHFTESKDGKPVRAIGFTMTAADGKGGTGIRLISTENPGVSDRLYRDPAPHFPAPSPYGLGKMLGAKEKPAAGDEPWGHDPDAVLLIEAADFEGAPAPRSVEGYTTGLNYAAYSGLYPSAYASSAMPMSYVGGYSPCASPCGSFAPVAPVAYAPLAAAPGAPVAFAGVEDGRTAETRRFAAVRAIWAEPALKPTERSTIFAFTSNEPPTFDATRVRGLPPGVVAAAGADVRTAELKTDGEVPTPITRVAFETAAPATGAVGGQLGSLGGVGPVGGAGVGLPVGGAALGTAPAGSTGGGAAGSTGGGRQNQPQQTQQNQHQNQPQNQNQSQSQPQNQTINQSTTVNVKQQQQQQQQQKQKQSQSQSNTDGAPMVPEPAALVLILLGLPFVFLFGRRRLALAIARG